MDQSNSSFGLQFRNDCQIERPHKVDKSYLLHLCDGWEGGGCDRSELREGGGGSFDTPVGHTHLREEKQVVLLHSSLSF